MNVDVGRGTKDDRAVYLRDGKRVGDVDDDCED